MNTEFEEDQREALEHRDMLMDVRAVLLTSHGQSLFRYLFRNLEVTELPQMGIEGNLLHDHLGFLRAGRSIFKLAAEANPELAGQLLASVEREKHDKLLREAKA